MRCGASDEKRDAATGQNNPAFVIGDTLVPGAVDRQTLERLVAQARAKQS